MINENYIYINILEVTIFYLTSILTYYFILCNLLYNLREISQEN